MRAASDRDPRDHRGDRAARRRWLRATGIRLALLLASAAAGLVVYLVVDSAWLAWAVALFVLMNAWALYLFVRYRNAPRPAAPSAASNSTDAAVADEQAARRAAYQQVVHDLFPLASRPQLFSRPFKGADDAWRRSGKKPPDDENDEQDENG